MILPKFLTSVDIEGRTEKYTFEIGPNCYNHEEYDEFLIYYDAVKVCIIFGVLCQVIDTVSIKSVIFYL